MLEAVAQQEQTSYYVADIKPCSEFKLLRLRSASSRTGLPSTSLTSYLQHLLYLCSVVGCLLARAEIDLCISESAFRILAAVAPLKLDNSSLNRVFNARYHLPYV